MRAPLCRWGSATLATMILVASCGTAAQAWQAESTKSPPGDSSKIASDAMSRAEDAKMIAEQAKKIAEQAKSAADAASKAIRGGAVPITAAIDFEDGDLDRVITILKKEGWYIQSINGKKITATLNERHATKKGPECCPKCKSVPNDSHCHSKEESPSHCPECDAVYASPQGLHRPLRAVGGGCMAAHARERAKPGFGGCNGSP
jgi:hypothetical protein